MLMRTLDPSIFCKKQSIYNNEKVCAMVHYDINGDKEPNQVGIDIFMFIVTPTKLLPNPNNTCKKNNSGTGCANYIIKNGNMKYLD